MTAIIASEITVGDTFEFARWTHIAEQVDIGHAHVAIQARHALGVTRLHFDNNHVIEVNRPHPIAFGG